MKICHKILVIILTLLLILAGVFTFINISDDEEIGSNNVEYVTKKTYSHYGDSEH